MVWLTLTHLVREVDGEVCQAVVLLPVPPDHGILYLTVPGRLLCEDGRVEGNGLGGAKELLRIVVQDRDPHNDGERAQVHLVPVQLQLDVLPDHLQDGKLPWSSALTPPGQGGVGNVLKWNGLYCLVITIGLMVSIL